MFALRLILLLCLTYGFGKAALDDRDAYSTTSERSLPEVCYPKIPEGRVPWIIYHRHSDYGWKEHTHRANIALAVNFYRENKTEMDMMELQLEVEIANALLGSKKIHDNDLALYIHSLIATSKNPRNFHGKDLVDDLLARVNEKLERFGKVHPFLVLALCNSHSVKLNHLTNLKHLTEHKQSETTEETELKALALKAYACAASLGKRELDKFGDQMKSAAECLETKQASDGSIGNAYTTALAVQALIASPLRPSFKKSEAIYYLTDQSVINVNMIKAYYIELALNAESVRFIKDLYEGPPMVPLTPPVKKDFLHYTIRADVRPHIYHTITIQFDERWNFYDVMHRCFEESPVFKFDYYFTKDNLPMIYSVSGIPNDAEENMFWRICLQKRNGGNPIISEWETFKDSPMKLGLNSNDDITFWYRSTDCA